MSIYTDAQHTQRMEAEAAKEEANARHSPPQGDSEGKTIPKGNINVIKPCPKCGVKTVINDDTSATNHCVNCMRIWCWCCGRYGDSYGDTSDCGSVCLPGPGCAHEPDPVWRAQWVNMAAHFSPPPPAGGVTRCSTRDDVMSGE
jgi:hypothetical protein